LLGNGTWYLDNFEILEELPSEILRVDARNGSIENKYAGEKYLSNKISNSYDWIDSNSDGFADGFTYWTFGGSTASGSIVTGNGFIGRAQRITSTGGTSYFALHTGFTMTSGKTYYFSMKYRSDSGLAGFQVQNESSISLLALSVNTGDAVFVSGTFTAPSTQVLLIRANGVSSNWIEVDELQCYEIIPSITNTSTTLKRAGDIYAMDFNGTSSKVDCGSYDTLMGDKTFVAWIKPRSFGESNLGRIFDNNMLGFYFNSSDSKIEFTSQAPDIANTAVNSIVLNKYHFFVCTRTSDGVTNFYINGVLNGSADQDSGTPAAGTTNIILGNRNAQDRTFDGQISNVRIIDGILTTYEISQLYSSERRYYE